MTAKDFRAGLCGLLGLAGLLASAQAARALDLCQLATADTFAKASSVLEGDGCTVSSEEGTTRRSFVCSGGGLVHLEDKSGMISIVTPGSVKLEAAARCGADGWTRSSDTYDNPLVLNVYSLGSRYLSNAQFAVVSLDRQTPFLTWLCVGEYSCSMRFDSGLKGVLDKYLGDGTLKFSSSQIRVAGLDITAATRAQIEQELVHRGAVVSAKSGGPLISQTTFGQVSGVPGLSAIELAYLADRITVVRYPIAAEGDYAGFAKSLDERYGAASASTAKGCATRAWSNGGVTILGEFCAATPARNGFTFVNTGAAAIVKGLDKIASTPQAPAGKPQAKPKTDMY